MSDKYSNPILIAMISLVVLFFGIFLADAATTNIWWGNIGIGKIPVSNLDVIGGTSFTGVINSTSLCIAGDCKTSWSQVSGGGIPTGTSGQTLRSNGTAWVASSLLYNNGTNIGINTTNPQAILDIFATSTSSSVPAPPTSQTYNNSSVGYTGTQYTWTVPTTATYTIDAYGAEGGRSTGSSNMGGKGARMKGDFTLNAGEVIKILVGQKGSDYSNDGCGGGGTYVVKQSGNVPILVAGGGGGASTNATYGAGMDGVTSTTGSYDRANSCTPGSSGNGGQACGNSASGAGFSGNGQGGSHGNHMPYSYLNGGNGGMGAYYGSYYGGYGGGGATHGGGWGGGGGGGYSGGAGASSSDRGAGGGGSYNIGTNQTNSAGYNSGQGKVIIYTPGVGTILITTHGQAAIFNGYVNLNGALKVGDPGADCTSQLEGMIKYSSSTKSFLGCDGVGWQNFIAQ